MAVLTEMAAGIIAVITSIIMMLLMPFILIIVWISSQYIRCPICGSHLEDYTWQGYGSYCPKCKKRVY